MLQFIINRIAMLGFFALVTILICAQASPTNVANEVIYEQTSGTTERRFDTEKRIARDGYYSESHTVTTSDGYILEVQRIPLRRFEDAETTVFSSKPVVLLMPGLQGSSLSYITLGPGRSLAYLLAEDGYDVWLGNARGGLNSRRHVYLDPDNDAEKFFDYSYEDIGMKDLSAMIDYILRITGRSQLHYVGHSQGGTAFLILNTMLPAYNTKIQSAHLLAGVGYMDNFPNPLLSMIAFTTDPIYAYAIRNGILEILGPDTLNSLNEDCKGDTTEACSILSIWDILEKLGANFEIVAGASIKQYAHFGQNIRSKLFRRWNFNPLTNLVRYGSFTPPEYDISKVTMDVTMHYTLNDDLLDEKDVIKMSKVLPNAKTRKVARESYTHTDFVIAPDSKELVYDYILDELRKQKHTQI